MQDARHTTRIRPLTMPWRRFALKGVVAALAMSAMNTALAESAPADDEVAVRMLPSAVVASEVIRLRDIAEIEGDSASTVGQWAIVTGLHAGEAYVVTLKDLQKVLQRRGVNLGKWEFRGHNRCRVQRPDAADGHPVTPGQPALADSSNAPENKQTIRPDRTESTGQLAVATTPEYLEGVDPNTLDAELRRHIAGRLESLGGRPVIRFNAAAERYLKLAGPTYQFKITDAGQRLLGMSSFHVTILEGDRVRQNTQILAEVILEKEVVVARRLMNRGHVIAARDLELRAFPFKNLSDVQFTDPEPLIGQRARRLIDQGARIAPRDIEPVPLVQRNDLVTVWVRRGNLVIKSTAKAMDSAGYGEPVELKNARTREYFTGIVTGVRTVEIPNRRPGSAMTLADTRSKREKQ